MNINQLARIDDGGPRIVRIDDVPALDYIDADSRLARWRQLGLVPSLEKVSRIFADLDLARMQSSDAHVVNAFLSGVNEPARSEASAQLIRGNAVLHPIPIFVTINEIIEHADANGDCPVSDDELLAMFLSIATEAHEAAMPSQDAGIDQALAEMMVNRVAQASLLFPDPVELLATTTASTWHREWSARTSSKTTHDLAEGPAAQWTEITGVELDDFLSLGWLFYNLWRHEGFSRIGADFFTTAAISPAAVDFLLAHCSLTVDEFRTLLAQDREDDASLWTRYKLQQFPFVRLDDDTLLPIRFQFVIQRIFGDHLYLESEALLREHNSKKADHYAEAMRNIFEERVGEVLDRICSYDRSGETVLVAEEQMKLAWRTSKSKLPKICDFALFRGHGCILVDANMRNLPQPFAEGSGTFESLQNEIDQRFATTKFRQLLSTVDLFMTRGWHKLHTAVTERTRFVPLVVVPDAGIPSDITMENTVFVKGMALVQKYNDNPNFYRVHVPAILCWRDLLILDGLAEKGVDVFSVLTRWRNIDPRGRNGRERLPLPLRDYVDRRHPNTTLSQREHRRGWDFFERLQNHVDDRTIATAPPHLRGSLAHAIEQRRRRQPTWENRGEFQMRSGRAVHVHKPDAPTEPSPAQARIIHE